MGSEAGRPDEQPVHVVTVRPFLLGATPVTREEYLPFLLASGGPEPPRFRDGAFARPRQPVVGVTWDEAARYAEWLAREVGRPCRLPSEAEWERAARGGLRGGATAWGPELPEGEVPEGPLEAPWDAGTGRPNGYGLLDMGTIVHEWCLDWYQAEYYASAPEFDPRGPDEGVRRSSRGGSWRHHVRFSSPAARSSLLPDLRYLDYGFRVLCEET
jgi:formylglycine-generating enzyme required for sulfatase activity